MVSYSSNKSTQSLYLFFKKSTAVDLLFSQIGLLSDSSLSLNKGKYFPLVIANKRQASIRLSSCVSFAFYVFLFSHFLLSGGEQTTCPRP